MNIPQTQFWTQYARLALPLWILIFIFSIGLLFLPKPSSWDSISTTETNAVVGISSTPSTIAETNELSNTATPTNTFTPTKSTNVDISPSLTTFLTGTSTDTPTPTPTLISTATKTPIPPTRTPSPTPTNTPTVTTAPIPTDTPTVTVEPTTTPILRDTPIVNTPISTSQELFSYLAPKLVSPENGAEFSGKEANIELAWEGVSLSNSAQYGVTIIRHHYSGEIYYDSHLIETTSMIVPSYIYDDIGERDITWYVVVVRNGVINNGRVEGDFLSPPSKEWVFIWKVGGSGETPPVDTPTPTKPAITKTDTPAP